MIQRQAGEKLKDNSKLAKAYWVAWRWPEVYSDDVWVIWTSRVIAVALPLGLIGLTLVTGVPLLGWAATGVIAAIMGLAIILTTIRLFYTEYDTVEDFDARESRVKEFFHGFPAHTDVPLTELEPGVWVAYGHIPEDDFINAIRNVVRNVTEDSDIVALYDGLEKSVGHTYAAFRNPAEAHWDEGLDLCKGTERDCFPITRVEV
jgi:hypothetical protein